MMTNATHTPDAAELAARLERVEAELAHTRASLDELVAHARAQSDFIDEMRPVAKSMMDAGVDKLGDYESRGYFAFGRSALRVADRVVASYSPEDVDALGDSVVAILDTVRALTQPEVLALVQEGAETLEQAEEASPIGVVGLARASGDVNVQKGLGVLVAGLRHVGRASRVLGKKTRKLRRPGDADGHAVPPRPAAPRPAAPPRAASCATPAPPMAAPTAAVFPEVAGVGFDPEGFLADPAQWSEGLAEAIAADLGVGPLGERHWEAVNAARRLHAESGKSPNIRKLTSSSDVDTKELYRLFPRAPGKTVARIAGIPKPVGCL
jgi:dissimilatory sulfite reductase related protein